MLSVLFAERLDLSLSLEVDRALKTSQKYLLSQQSEQGYWTDDQHPALTALAISAILKGPKLDENGRAQIEKGIAYIKSLQKPDGGIYGTEGLLTYNTALSVSAMSDVGSLEDKEIILKARDFIIGQQREGDAESGDEPFAGGIGYGNSYSHSDMSNTMFALEAIRKSEKYVDETNEDSRLNWDAAMAFVSRAQNLSETNDQEWASDDEKNKGGFVYFPGNSKAGEDLLEDGRTALRSYGSISYAGLMSMIYAKLSIDDPRVVAVKEWLSKNYTLDENPGMELQGLYYYYQAMAKSLNAAGVDVIYTVEGKEVLWRNELGTRLVQTQKTDGRWENENSRWWETDPVMVTSYVMLTLANVK